ncbi:polysaccharide lyase family 7 protein [Pseudonocardia sp. MH-G8]|uniref:polysaccharide lyase family 7 protein n=1 Tax=Pseudonocardia sp. MH-G8 TaxID=1854588 RepID=UPI000BA17006|nr:polysaccharide lyase family 7 protein [Pseudonocardia sp. MH-G8]OZM78841.1 hypothetical protein CFP66_28160 [Pseudonocardia sp. MH-G8]
MSLTVIATAALAAAPVLVSPALPLPAVHPIEVRQPSSSINTSHAVQQDPPTGDDDESSDESSSDSSDDSSENSGDDESGAGSNDDTGNNDTGNDDTGAGDSTRPAPGAGDWRAEAAKLAAVLERSEDPEALELADQLAALGITAGGRSGPTASGGRNGRQNAERDDHGGRRAAEAPAQLLDVTDWKLTLPGGAEGDPTEILPSELRSFVEDGIFHLTPEGDGVVFRAEVGGATTKNSNYPRSELREMAGGEEEASWSNTSGSHTLEVRQAITETPPTKPHVVAAQIHDGSDDVLQIRLEGTTLAVQYNDGNDQVVIDPDYQLGTPYDLRIVAADNRVLVYYNGGQAAELPLHGSSWYFKVGAYTQSNPEKGDEPGAAGEVVVYDLALDHGEAPR